jgi:hypothetical protein
MRVEPDFAPATPRMQSAKDGPPKGRETERQHAKPNSARVQNAEKDPNDYDDGAWM